MEPIKTHIAMYKMTDKVFCLLKRRYLTKYTWRQEYTSEGTMVKKFILSSSCVLCLMLPMSLDVWFLIAPLVISTIYLLPLHNENKYNIPVIVLNELFICKKQHNAIGIAIILYMWENCNWISFHLFYSILIFWLNCNSTYVFIN
jgi:hypothetical protein